VRQGHEKEIHAAGRPAQSALAVIEGARSPGGRDGEKQIGGGAQLSGECNGTQVEGAKIGKAQNSAARAQRSSTHNNQAE
jgi:hypothetical protein